MLGYTNRLGVFTPNAVGVGRNIIGSAAEILAVRVPEPSSLILLATGPLGFSWRYRHR